MEDQMAVKKIVHFVLVAFVSSLIFILANIFIHSAIIANLVASITSICSAILLGYLNIRTLGSNDNTLPEIITNEHIESEKNTELIRQFAHLADKVKNIANMLGNTSGYMDTLTHQTEQNAKEIAIAFSDVVEGTSQESESIQQVAKQLDMMAAATSGIAKGAEEQAKSVGYATDTSNKVNFAIEGIAEKANNAAQASSQAAEAAHEGGETIKATVLAINNIRDKVGQSAEKVREMGARSKEISIIVDKIKDIASQTNLLALNAAIEAARAGEMGRGFAVVASEVRKLAENSVVATKEVNNLVTAIQKSAYEAVSTMDLGVAEVQNGVELASKSGKALEGIISTSELVYKELKDVVELTQQQMTLSQELGNAMESVSAVVEENSASTEEMSAESEGIAREIEKISEISSSNNTRAVGMSTLTDQISNLVADSTASAQTLAEMASALQNLVAENSSSQKEISNKTRTRSPQNKPTIGIVIPKIIPFWETAIKFAQKGADELGVNLVICDSQERKEIMEKHISDLVDKKVDGILWVPYFELGRKGLTMAKNTGIPVLLIDSYEGGLQPQSEEFQNYRAFVGPADETGAYEMGNYLLSHLPASKDGKKYIAALDGTEGAPVTIIRHKGLLRAIKEHPETVLVDSKKSGFDYDQAKTDTAEMLKKYPQIQGVWAASDSMIQGAMAAAKGAGRTPGKDILFVGMDLDSTSIKAIRAGEQLFDVGGHWLQLGFGLNILYDEINGFPFPKGRSIVKLPLLSVVQDKVDQFEKDFPNGIPVYDFKQKSRAYNPENPVSVFEVKYSTD
jgi:methyl-accepting chemotaxis protein/ABC-type sugar transport system substrate-binding protein